MKIIFESLCPEAQEDLLSDGFIELVTVRAPAVPDHGRPEDRLAFTIAGEVSDDGRES